MFKKSRRKIIGAILLVLVLVLSGTFCVIYLASYVDMTNENRKLLEQYVNTYSLPGPQADASPGEDGTGGAGREDFESIAGDKEGFDRGTDPGGGRGGRRGDPPLLELSTFYSVVISESGEVVKVDTADISLLDEEGLSELALEIAESGESDGVRNNLIYRMEDKGGYTLVAFLDNTVMLENVETLLSYTLFFGGAALVVLFFLARYLAGKIVSPLEESYLSQRQFISDAGHELKTPVAVINANLELLSREIGGNQWLSNIQYENERMSSLVIQLLELARAENVTPQMEPLDLSRLVYGEILPFETVAYEKGLTLNSEISENICVSGSGTQLKQLASILIDNAVRHSSRGNEVRVILGKEKGHVILSVINDGEEIPPEQQKHLFERFYRTDEARSGEDGHYGLGLAIARAIVTAHKGTIAVCCHHGKVEFTAKLPLQKQN